MKWLVRFSCFHFGIVWIVGFWLRDNVCFGNAYGDCVIVGEDDKITLKWGNRFHIQVFTKSYQHPERLKWFLSYSCNSILSANSIPLFRAWPWLAEKL